MSFRFLLNPGFFADSEKRELLLANGLHILLVCMLISCI